jgi:acyl-CoA hydrolase
MSHARRFAVRSTRSKQIHTRTLTHSGGENVATGALIGALIGGQVGFSKLPPALVSGLAKSQQTQIHKEVRATRIPPACY